MGANFSGATVSLGTRLVESRKIQNRSVVPRLSATRPLSRPTSSQVDCVRLPHGRSGDRRAAPRLLWVAHVQERHTDTVRREVTGWTNLDHAVLGYGSVLVDHLSQEGFEELRIDIPHRKHACGAAEGDRRVWDLDPGMTERALNRHIERDVGVAQDVLRLPRILRPPGRIEPGLSDIDDACRAGLAFGFT